MFVVFTDRASTANIYTHEFNITGMHAAERLLLCESLYPQNIPAIRYVTFLNALQLNSSLFLSLLSPATPSILLGRQNSSYNLCFILSWDNICAYLSINVVSPCRPAGLPHPAAADDSVRSPLHSYLYGLYTRAIGTTADRQTGLWVCVCGCVCVVGCVCVGGGVSDWACTYL